MSEPTFDGSSGATGTATYDDGRNNGAPVTGPTAEPFAPDSLLDDLRAQITERDEDPIPLWEYKIKGTRIRLVCDPDIENDDYQRWFKLSMPRARGRRRQQVQSAADMDQLALSARAIIESNVSVDILRGETWVSVPGSNGEPLVLADQQILREFNVMDPVSLLKKLFRRDAELIDAGQELLGVAGYLGEDDEDPDPTPPVRSGRNAKKA